MLLLHGLLHLAGFDHEIDSGEMAAREAELRAKLRTACGFDCAGDREEREGQDQAKEKNRGCSLGSE